MLKKEEFVKQVETILTNRVGEIIARSVLKNNLSKLNKDVSNMTRDDCRLLIKNIVQAITLFSTPDESRLAKIELEKIIDKLD